MADARESTYPSIPLVKPVRTFRCTLCFTLAVATLIAADASAQDSFLKRRSVRRSERVARATWQPVRNDGSSTKSENTREPSEAERRRRSRVRVVQGSSGETLPAPSDESISVIETPPGERLAPGEPIGPAPLDGQIMLEPIADGAVACDALPVAGGCGSCGGVSCDGGCGAPGTLASCGGDPACGELCSDVAWRPCLTLCLPQDGWGTFELLGWWQAGMELPPLVTTSRDPSVARSDAGVLGRPTTDILFGGDEVLTDSFEGGRLSFGFWFDKQHTWGIGAEYFDLGERTESFRATSSGAPVLARPFFNTESGVNDSSLVAYPGVISGTVNVDASSDLVGWGVHFKRLRCVEEGCSSWLFCGHPDHYCARTERMLGYRYVELDESLTVVEESVGIDPTGRFDILDRFETRNQFNGFDIGWSYKQIRGYWTLKSRLRLGVGNTHQTVTINGQTTIEDPNNPPSQTFTGGTLAQTSNIGTYEQDEFTVIPQVDASLGYQLTDHLKVTLGYTFLYWSNVVRPGDHVSLDLNPNLLPPQADPFSGAQRPGFDFDTTDYWAQGINFGGEYRW